MRTTLLSTDYAEPRNRGKPVMIRVGRRNAAPLGRVPDAGARLIHSACTKGLMTFNLHQRYPRSFAQWKPEWLLIAAVLSADDQLIRQLGGFTLFQRD